jgi:hypothetical protein
MKPYDNYEISPCTRTEEPDRPGIFYYEVCEPHEADVWTLYGHSPEGGVEAIGDFATREHAEQTFQRITGVPFGTHDEVAARVRLMHAGPRLLAFAARIARMTQDGEEIDGRDYVMENDVAYTLLHEVIDEARGLVAGWRER